LKKSKLIEGLITAAIDSVRPENFIPANISLNYGVLSIQDKNYELGRYSHIYLVSVGKAAFGMAAALDTILSGYVTEGIILSKHLPENPGLGQNYKTFCGGHPVPTAESLTGAEAILELLDKAGKNDLVIFLISGGGSALMSKPLNVDLQTLQSFSKSVLSCGADIKEFNTLRKHLDGVKGGRLALHAAPAQQITLILSDVVGSPTDVIASGPTVPDPTSYKDALQIYDRYAGQVEFPSEIRRTLEMGATGELPETLKDGSKAGDVFLLASNRTAAYASAAYARSLGLNAAVLNTQLTGEASEVGALLPSFFSELEKPGVLVFGGETTVHLKANGFGGRNLETALAAVRPMAEWQGCTLVTLATDGEDGPTDAAGAIVTDETLENALLCGCDPDEYLQKNDSYRFFEKTGGLLRPGSTGTNVNDLIFMLKIPSQAD
jgi:hydroxypyruvate reductase